MNFECLANELLIDLFEYFDGVDLLRAFSGLNSRFNNLLFNYFRNYSFDFRCVSRNDFDILCKEYFPSIVDRVVSIRLSNADETPGQIDYFLCEYPKFNELVNLQSLSLFKIDGEETMNEIMNELSHLHNLIDLSIVDSWYFESKHIDIIWSLPKLTHCKLDRIFHMYLNVVPGVVSLSLRNVSIWCSTDDRSSINRLLKYTPNIENLSMSLIDHDGEQISFDIPSIKSFKVYVEDFARSLKNVLSHMRNLYKLNVNAWDIHWDGYKWEKIIRNNLPKLKIFELSMRIPSTNNINAEEKVDEILNSFRTSFWINEHRWFVRCHWNSIEDDSSGYHLYTLPYKSNTIQYPIGKYFKSTCPNENHYSSYDSIQILDYSIASIFDSHLLFRNFRELSLTFPINEKFWSIIPTLDQLNILCIKIKNDEGNDEIQWQKLLDKTPQLNSLKFISKSIPKIFLSSQISNKSIHQLDFEYVNEYFNEETCYTLIHSPLANQCRFITIKLQNPTNIFLLINQMKNLRTLKVQLKENTLIQWLQQQQYLALIRVIYNDILTDFIRLWIR